MQTMLEEKVIYLRSAEPDDIQLIFQWANDPTVRKNAFSTKKIAWEEHVQWYTRLMESDNAKLYIMVHGDQAIGQLRLDLHGESAEITYSVAPQYRCMGYGKSLLSLAAEQVRTDFPQLKRLTARVKPDNVASKRAFLDTGYVETCSVFELDLKSSVSPPPEISGSIDVIFLTNNDNTLPLYDWISRCGTQTALFSGPIELEQLLQLSPKLIVSYNYVHLIPQDVIDHMGGRVVNLHISLLPWNRGFSPNIWSFLEDTPKGVTIHQVDAGLDTGGILYQKMCCFDPQRETLASSYNVLQRELVALFQTHWEDIFHGAWAPIAQSGAGSYHTKRDLAALRAAIQFDLNDRVADIVAKYRSLPVTKPAEMN